MCKAQQFLVCARSTLILEKIPERATQSIWHLLAIEYCSAFARCSRRAFSCALEIESQPNSARIGWLQAHNVQVRSLAFQFAC